SSSMACSVKLRESRFETIAFIASKLENSSHRLRVVDLLPFFAEGFEVGFRFFGAVRFADVFFLGVVGRVVLGGAGFARSGGASMLTRGTMRSSHLGNHQFAFPSSSIVDGTSTMRTTVASMKIAVARPRPSSFSTRRSPRTNDKNTAIMIAAAA